MRLWTLTVGLKGSKNGPRENIIAANGPMPETWERIEVVEKSEYDKLEAKLKTVLPCFCKGIK